MLAAPSSGWPKGQAGHISETGYVGGMVKDWEIDMLIVAIFCSAGRSSVRRSGLFRPGGMPPALALGPRQLIIGGFLRPDNQLLGAFSIQFLRGPAVGSLAPAGLGSGNQATSLHRRSVKVE